jgi:hypothetical protein
MASSLFQKKTPANPEPPTSYELIEPEIVHLKKGYSIRYGPKPRKKMSLWVVFLGFCGLAYLYLMDPILHAWYRGEAIKAYVYLHNYGAGNDAAELASTGILNPDEITVLDRRQGSFQDYYPSPQIAARHAQDVIAYMSEVKELHAGRYQELDPVGRMRYLLFIRTGLILPTSWTFLDPTVDN